MGMIKGVMAEKTLIMGARKDAQKKLAQQQQQLEARLQSAMDQREKATMLKLIKDAAFVGLLDDNATVAKAKDVLAMVEAVEVATHSVGDCLGLLDSDPHGVEIDLDVCRETLKQAQELIGTGSGEGEDSNVELLRSDVRELEAAVAEIEKRRHLEEVLATAVAARDLSSIQALKRSYIEAHRLQLPPALLERALEVLESLTLQTEILDQLAACRGDTTSPFSTAVEQGERLSQSAEVAAASTGASATSEESKDLGKLSELLSRAKDEGLSHELVRWAEHRVDQLQSLRRVQLCLLEANHMLSSKGSAPNPTTIAALRSQVDQAAMVDGVAMFPEAVEVQEALSKLEAMAEHAQSDEMHFSNFTRLRTAEDFFETVHGVSAAPLAVPLPSTSLRYMTVDDVLGAASADHSSEAAAVPPQLVPPHLRFQNWPLKNSLTVLDERDVATAKVCNRNILGFCGDVSLLYPTALAIDLISTGWHDDKFFLSDEIYCQLCRHLTGNGGMQSTWKGWLLLHLCLRQFRPSPQFEPFLRNFLIAEKGPMATLATAALSELDNLLDLGTNALTLITAEEIEDELNSPEQADLGRKARRASMLNRKQRIKNVASSFQAMQKVGIASSFPSELRELLEMSDKYGVDTAWERLQTVQRQVNAHRSLNYCHDVVFALLLTPDGCDSLTAQDFVQEIELAQTNGVRVEEVERAQTLLLAVEAQVATIEQLAAAVRARDVNALEVALHRASNLPPVATSSSYVNQLRAHAEATSLLRELNPTVLNSVSQAVEGFVDALSSVFAWN